MFKRAFVVVGLLVSLFWSPRVSAQSAAQQALDSVRVKYHLPAMLAAVIEPRRIRYVLGGVRRSDQPTPITLADYFHIGSNTKGITSLLAGKLVEQGKLRWDSKMLDVVPELRATALPIYADVTLDALLSHRAGIPPYNSGAAIARLPVFTGTTTEKRQQFAAFVLQQPPMLPGTGETYLYSNGGYAMAALMLERASGQSWDELVAAAFRKLKLQYLLGFPNRNDAQQPWGHWLQEDADTVLTPLGPAHAYKLQDFLAPAGDIAMPLPDFARLVQLHLRGLLGRSNYLSAKTYQLLHFGKPDYAYGWGVSKLASTGALVSYHNGTAGTFYCHAILYPSQRVAIVVLTNAGGDKAEAACYALRRHLKSLYLQGQL